MRQNAVLGLVVLLLAILVWWDAQRQVLWPAAPDSLLIQGAAFGELSVQRRGARWCQMPASGMALTEDSRARLMLLLEAPLRYSRELPEQQREALGLGATAIRIQGDGRELLLGHHDPLNNWRYVGEGNQLHLVEDRFAIWLQTALDNVLEAHPDCR